MNLSGSAKLNKITFNSKSAAIPVLENCTSLESIDFPPRYGGFCQGCTGLKTVTIGEGATEIAARSFKDCTSLTSISLPNTLTKIYNNAFENCSSLESITIPESVTEFGGSIFYTEDPRPEGFKIYFHSQAQLDLFLKNNGNKQYCEVISI